MVTPVANSFGSLREMNTCHAPDSGRFCSGAGSFAMSTEDSRKAVWYSFAKGGDWQAVPGAAVPASTLKPLAALARTGSTFPTTAQMAYLDKHVAVPDKPGHLTVYRVGKKSGGVENRNATNLYGLATFINQEGTGLLKRGLYVTAYYVKTGGAIPEGPRHYTSYAGRVAGATR